MLSFYLPVGPTPFPVGARVRSQARPWFDAADVAYETHLLTCATAIAGEWCGTCNRLSVAVNAARRACNDADANRTESR